MTWAKGVSGNPRGMAPGTVCKSTRLRNLIGERATEIIDKLIEAALNGDISAAKILIDRAIPPLRAESLPVNLDIQGKPSLVDIGDKVISAISSGMISAEQGSAILAGLVSQAKIIEVTDLERRLELLEKSQSKQDQQ